MLVYNSITQLLDKKELNPEDTLSSLHSAVGGCIERVPIPLLEDENIDVWCNEEGKLMYLNPAVLVVHNGEPIDVICGSIAFTGHDKDGGTIELTKEQEAMVEKVMEKHWFHGKDGIVFAEIPVFIV